MFIADWLTFNSSLRLSVPGEFSGEELIGIIIAVSHASYTREYSIISLISPRIIGLMERSGALGFIIEMII